MKSKNSQPKKQHAPVYMDEVLREALREESDERKAAGTKPYTMTAMNEYALRKTWGLKQREARIRAERQGGDAKS